MSRGVTNLSFLLFSLLCVLFTLKGQLMLTDTDFWWHLAAGDEIRKTGAIPVADSFSFTAGNYPWLNISWLWDVIYSWLNSVSPLYLPVIVTAIVNALTISILAAFMLKRGAGIVLTVAVILVALPSYAYMLTPRPHQITFLFTIIFYAVCALKNRKLLPLLPPLMILWVNMHGGFLVGFIILGAYLFESLVKREWKYVSLLFLTLLTCLVAVSLNPLGINIIEACQRTLSSALLPIISEWDPLKFNRIHALHLVYLAIFLISFRPLNKNVGLAEKLISIFWASQAFAHERNLPIFVLLSATVIALNLKQVFSMSETLRRKDADYERDLANIKRPALVVSVIIVVILLSTLPAKFLNFHIPSEHPIEEAEFIKNNYADRKFLNDYFQGGYLLYNGTKVFIDGRAETAYPDEVVDDYLKFHFSQSGWERMIDKYGITGVVLPKNNPNLQYFVKGWSKVFEGDLDVIYIRER